jgi:hypothetical protein
LSISGQILLIHSGMPKAGHLPTYDSRRLQSALRCHLQMASPMRAKHECSPS